MVGAGTHENIREFWWAQNNNTKGLILEFVSDEVDSGTWLCQDQCS